MFGLLCPLRALLALLLSLLLFICNAPNFIAVTDAVSVPQDNDQSGSVIKECQLIKSLPRSDHYHEVTVFSPYSRGTFGSERYLEGVQNVLISLIKQKLVSGDTFLRVVFNEPAEKIRCSSISCYYSAIEPQFADAIMHNVCEEVLHPTKYARGFLRYIFTGQISSDIGLRGVSAIKSDKWIDPSDELNLNSHNIATSYLTLWAHLNKTYNEDLVNSYLGFMSVSRRKPNSIHWSEVDVYPVSNPEIKKRKLVVITNTDVDYTSYITGGRYNVYDDYYKPKSYDMGYDTTVDGDVNHDITKIVDNYGAFRNRDYDVNDDIDDFKLDWEKQKYSPTWSTAVQYFGYGCGLPSRRPSRYYHNVTSLHYLLEYNYFPCVENGSPNSPQNKKDCDMYIRKSANFIKAGLHKHRDVLERHQYSPIFQLANGFNDRRNILEAVQLSAHKKGYLSGYSTSLLADLLMAYKVTKVIQLNTMDEINEFASNEYNDFKNVSVHGLQAMTSFTGCPTDYYEWSGGAPGRGQSDYDKRYNEYIIQSLCGTSLKPNRYFVHETMCLSLAETFNGLVDMWYPPLTRATLPSNEPDYMATLVAGKSELDLDMSSVNVNTITYDELRKKIQSYAISNIRELTSKKYSPFLKTKYPDHLIPSLQPRYKCLASHGLDLRPGSLYTPPPPQSAIA